MPQGILELRATAQSAEGSYTDKRIVRTHAALRSALIQLIEQQGLENFTVGDLCERAGVNRGTFYNHFKSKEDLLEYFESDIIAQTECVQEQLSSISLPSVLKAQVAKKPLPELVALFDYLRSQSAFLHAVLGPGGDIRFAPRLRDSVCTNLIQSILHERYRSNPTAFVNYYVAFFASAYLGVIARWIETGCTESSEDMARIAMRLLFIKPGETITL